MITIGSIVTVQEYSRATNPDLLQWTNTGIVQKIEISKRPDTWGQLDILLLTNSTIAPRVRYSMSSIIESEEIKKKNRAYKIELP